MEEPVEHSTNLPEILKESDDSDEGSIASIITETTSKLVLPPAPRTEVHRPAVTMRKPSADEHDPAKAAYEHIKKIRERFGVDSNLDPTSQSIVSNYQGLLERSLEKLSKDLFCEQAHFVLEVIQNADDNQYAPDRWLTLRFILSSERIPVFTQWFLCIDYSIQQQRENPEFNLSDDGESEMTSMNELRRMKIIPLRDQARLVSIDEFDQRTILFPLDKKTPYAKYLRVVLEDTLMIDERLLNLIEEKYPRRFESIKRLLKELGLTEALNIRSIYFNQILPVMMDDAQWPTKSDPVLIAYLICNFKDLYAVQPD
ncbi:unnamed protein product [Rotaria sp. Silwood2]|nr:unnamed protein product [Rotaria sp. Silwood2]CAF2833131.1 unnamed protein product [Rotaria sp. Silwood2]CAF3068336.1 unnamed protein product [Rotaria sp. Silwood2]CAF3228032.1 unnamed protein product [Rotaria sp. Silwood2]CAF4251649.1 unnamed protein product [Rotaria sp. Silwood2]